MPESILDYSGGMSIDSSSITDVFILHLELPILFNLSKSKSVIPIVDRSILWVHVAKTSGAPARYVSSFQGFLGVIRGLVKVAANGVVFSFQEKTSRRVYRIADRESVFVSVNNI